VDGFFMNPNRAERKQGHKDECAMVTVACQGNDIIHSTTIIIAKFFAICSDIIGNHCHEASPLAIIKVLL
jgi:hypothetical protein